MPRNRNKPRARRKPGDPLHVAVCIDTRDGPGRERLLGCYQYALERNWRLYLIRQDNADEIAKLAGISLDGAIFYDRSRELQEAVKNKNVVCVETSARHLPLDDAAVFVDDEALVRVAVEHLRAVGFEFFGYCGLAGSSPSSTRAKHLMALSGPAGHTFEDQRRDGQMDIEKLMRWLRSLPKPVGVLAFDDKMGERVLAACRWAGIRVPDEVGVIGIGDDELICELTLPRLTSVALPTRRIGRAAAETLEHLLSGKTLAQEKRWQRVAPLEVVSRASTDRLPPARPAVLKAVDFIRAESHRLIGTDEVAEAVGMSRRTLERAFNADLGQTVHDFFVELRLQNAKRLLRQTEMPLEAVSRGSGYSSLSSFMRMFAARTGKSPREYREHYRRQGKG